jgi:hypothetical protein
VGFSIISFGLYLVAFSTTYGGFRPVMGSLSTLVIVAMLGWIVFRSRRVTLGVPHLGFLAANATSVVGGVLGVLWAIQISTGDQYLPTGGEGAHPAVMVVGFLLPVAILLEIVGVVIFLFRMWPSFLGVSFTAATPGRWAVVSAVGSVFVIGLAQYLVVEYEGDFDLVPAGQLLALDHAQFIASMTSAVFAMLVAATAGRTDRRLQDLTFLLVSGGVAVFVIGLLADATALKRIGAPVMGVGLLIGLAAFAAALVADGRRHSSARLEAQP